MKILWIDLNCSYAHSSLALPALHAQMASDTSVEWDIVSATINENVGMIVDEIYRRRPDILAATAWLFNHEQLMHITSRVKALLPDACLILGGPEFWEIMKSFCVRILLSTVYSEEREKKRFRNGWHAGNSLRSGTPFRGSAI